MNMDDIPPPIHPTRTVSNVETLIISSRKRNYMLSTHRRDGLIEWMKEMLHHSFALDARESYYGTMAFFEDLIDEHRNNPTRSRLISLVPSVSVFHTNLPLVEAFRRYDAKYSVSKRCHIAPTFNEIRHILNLAQVMAINENLKLITFDGDQTLYNDGGNFDAYNDELALGIIRLLCHGVKVALITAAGYGWNSEKYEYRIQGLLTRFVEENLTKENMENFYVFGGECNYLYQCTLLQTPMNNRTSTSNNSGTTSTHSANTMMRTSSIININTTTTDSNSTSTTSVATATTPTSQSMTMVQWRAKLVPVPIDIWNADHLQGPKPYFWSTEEIQTILNIAETTMIQTVQDLKLRAKVLRKERSVGTFPGGSEAIKNMPIGHGSNRLKREALDELVLRILEALRIHDPPIHLPYCVFNGGTDAWLDVGNKKVAVAVLQGFLQVQSSECLHVGDQFLNTGNDLAARETTPCIWIINPRETGKILQRVLKFKKIAPISHDEGLTKREMKEGDAAKLNVYTG
jgi:IMP and pyridine-specific 5'-nucleotidase